jgi:hypothetical protein
MGGETGVDIHDDARCAQVSFGKPPSDIPFTTCVAN